MKRRIHTTAAAVLAACLFLLTGTGARASDNYLSYASYTFSLHHQLADIHAYTGDVDVLTIPETILGYPVNGIDDYAFYQRGDLTELILQNATQLKTIGKCAFFGCFAFRCAEIPAAVESLGESAFQNCTALEQVVFDGSQLTAVAAQTFYGCTSLQEIELPASVTSIGDYAFGACTGLERVVIPPSIAAISDTAFDGCDQVTLYCCYNTAAYRYAKQHELDFVLYDPPFDLSDAQILIESDCVAYNSRAQEPSITVKLGGEVLTQGKEYTVAFRDNLLPGEASVTINGCREYSGTASAAFRIRDLLGDTTGNGKVDILDATRIQRLLAGFQTEDAERVRRCGTITSQKLSILDATAIQRYLASIDNRHGVGSFMELSAV